MVEARPVYIQTNWQSFFGPISFCIVPESRRLRVSLEKTGAYKALQLPDQMPGLVGRLSTSPKTTTTPPARVVVWPAPLARLATGCEMQASEPGTMMIDDGRLAGPKWLCGARGSRQFNNNIDSIASHPAAWASLEPPPKRQAPRLIAIPSALPLAYLHWWLAIWREALLFGVRLH